MAVKVNGTPAAGRGDSGQSPYEVAKANGFAGTAAEYNAAFASLAKAGDK